MFSLLPRSFFLPHFKKSPHHTGKSQKTDQLNNLFYSICLTYLLKIRKRGKNFTTAQNFLNHKMFISFCVNSEEHFYFGKNITRRHVVELLCSHLVFTFYSLCYLPLAD